MYEICEILCRLLGELYSTETPLNLIIWPPADIEALADRVEYAVSEQDTKAVLARIDAISEEQRFESDVSAGAMMDLIKRVEEAVSRVMVPVELPEVLPIIAGQTLWHREWTVRDENHPVPESITRHLTDAARVYTLLKKQSLYAARAACTDPIQRNPLRRKPPH